MSLIGFEQEEEVFTPIVGTASPASGDQVPIITLSKGDVLITNGGTDPRPSKMTINGHEVDILVLPPDSQVIGILRRES